MGQWPKEGGAWGCIINAHRGNYDGTICSNPCNWNCGSKQQFRERFCAQGDDRCFQVSAFAADDPFLRIGANGGQWLFDENPGAFDHQVLFLYTKYFDADYGVVPNRGDFLLAGIYLVDRVETLADGTYKVVPRKDGALDVSELRVPSGFYDRVPNRPYLVQFDDRNVNQMLRDLEHASQKTGRKNVTRFLTEVRAQLRTAWGRNEKRIEALSETLPVYDEEMTSNAFGVLDGFKPAEPLVSPGEYGARSSVAMLRSSESEPVRSSEDVGRGEQEDEITEGRRLERENPLTALESWEAMQRTCGLYQHFVAQSLWLGTRGVNPLVILTGPPGVGKSTLALNLARPEHTHVVSVSSNWRGREDLWGWANPADGEFRPTPFAKFLRDASVAWTNGDMTPRVVVFEEFNIAPPEFWFSDFLVRSQYDPNDVEQRRVPLDGTPRGDWRKHADGVSLPPNLVFVATVNDDHTTERLSPRVLDRASMIPIEVQTEQLFEWAGLDVNQSVLDAVVSLDRWLRPIGVPVSMRTLGTIAGAVESIEGTGITKESAFDVILTNQLLPQVRLFATEPAHLDFITSLTDDWVESFGAVFPTCSSRFELWKEKLEAGHDVGQG